MSPDGDGLAAIERDAQAKPTSCPGCAATMRAQPLASKIAGELTVDLCAVPVAILDPDEVAATISTLQDAEAKRKSVDVAALVEAMRDAQQRLRGSPSWLVLNHQGSSATIDLVRLGLDTIADSMTG